MKKQTLSLSLSSKLKHYSPRRTTPGFTIVELLIVIVVIGILATIVVVSYSGISQKAQVASLTSDLDSSNKKLKLYQVDNGTYPTGLDCSASPATDTICLKSSNGTTYTTFTPNNTTSPQTFCLTATNGTAQYTVSSEDTNVIKGACAGLLASYYTNMTLSGTSASRQIESTVDYSWGNGAPGVVGIGADNFSIRWSGYVTAPTTGTYTFSVTSDDGERLYVNNTLLVDKWVNQGTTTWTGTIALTAGQKVPIVYEMYENGGGATARLWWTVPGGSSVVIPSSVLSHI